MDNFRIYDTDETKYTKGSVYWARLLPWKDSAVLIKKRPVVIVSSLVGSLTNQVVTVCPLTTKLKDISVNIDIDFSIDGRKSQVCCSQITTIPKYALQEYAGEMSVEDVDRVSNGILLALGLSQFTAPDIVKAREETTQLTQARQQIETLIPQAKAMIEQLSAAIATVSVKPKISFPKVEDDYCPPRAKALFNPAPIKPAPAVKAEPKTTKRTYAKRTPEEIKLFMEEWEDPYNDKAEVAHVFGFSTKGVAATFYRRHKEQN